jgi:hypothetical protein
LVDPPEAVIRFERRLRQTLQQVLHLRAGFRRQRDLQHWIVLAEDLRQHLLGVVARQFQPIRRLFAGEFLHLIESNSDTRLRLDQKVRLSQKAREQHAVPVLVGAFLNDACGVLYARLCVTPVPKLPAMRADAIAERALLSREVLRCFRLTHAKLRHGLAGAGLSHAARLLDSGLKVLP